MAGSEPPASPPEPPKEVVTSETVEKPAPMEEDEHQKAGVTRSQSSVRTNFPTFLLYWVFFQIMVIFEVVKYVASFHIPLNS